MPYYIPVSDLTLLEFLRTKAVEHGVPGAAIAISIGNDQEFACHGVGSTDNPRSIERDTFFLAGSISKTYTATAAMCLVAAGKLELEAPVRRYLPELRLPDEEVAGTVTVLQCLNHTNGWAFQLPPGSGEGDDALAGSVASMGESADFGAHGSGRASYSNAGFAVAGRIVEKLTGATFEDGVRSLLLEPLGMTHTAFHTNEIMTRRFAVGHNAQPDGSVAVTHPWKGPRAGNPWGGIATSIADLLTWGRFHLGDGPTPQAKNVLTSELLEKMQQPTADFRGSTLGDAVGIGWMLRDINGTAVVGHDGSMQSQFTLLLLIPEHRFAVVSAVNCAPSGLQFNQEVVRWALDTYVDVIDRDPEPIIDPERAKEVIGTYATDALVATITPAGEKLLVEITPTATTRERSSENGLDFPPFELGLLPRQDEYTLVTGPYKGMGGVFTRDGAGEITGLDFVGRLYRRVDAPV